MNRIHTRTVSAKVIKLKAALSFRKRRNDPSIEESVSKLGCVMPLEKGIAILVLIAYPVPASSSGVHAYFRKYALDIFNCKLYGKIIRIHDLKDFPFHFVVKPQERLFVLAAC